MSDNVYYVNPDNLDQEEADLLESAIEDQRFAVLYPQERKAV